MRAGSQSRIAPLPHPSGNPIGPARAAVGGIAAGRRMRHNGPLDVCPDGGRPHNNMFKIIFIDGKLQGRRLTVRQGRVRIGRGVDCAIRLADPAAADRHAELEERNGTVVVRNLDAVTGTTVNGVRMAAPEQELGALDEVRIGSTGFRIESAATAAPPAAGGRRTGTLQALTYASMLVILVLQGFVIARLSHMRTEAGVDAGDGNADAPGGDLPAAAAATAPGALRSAPPAPAAPVKLQPRPSGKPAAFLLSSIPLASATVLPWGIRACAIRCQAGN